MITYPWSLSTSLTLHTVSTLYPGDTKSRDKLVTSYHTNTTLGTSSSSKHHSPNAKFYHGGLSRHSFQSAITRSLYRVRQMQFERPLRTYRRCGHVHYWRISPYRDRRRTPSRSLPNHPSPRPWWLCDSLAGFKSALLPSKRPALALRRS